MNTLTFFHRTPRPREATKVVEDDFTKVDEEVKPEDELPYKPTIQWQPVFFNLFIHFGSLVGFYQMLTLQPKWQTYIWCKGILQWNFPHNFSQFFLYLTGTLVMATCNLSVCIGIHRLWSHRSFKVTRPLKLALLFFYTMSGQVNCFLIHSLI